MCIDVCGGMFICCVHRGMFVYTYRGMFACVSLGFGFHHREVVTKARALWLLEKVWPQFSAPGLTADMALNCYPLGAHWEHERRCSTGQWGDLSEPRPPSCVGISGV